MTERPSLMSAPMVLAVLAGRKTQTRRKIAIPRSTGAYICADYGGVRWPYVSCDGESLHNNHGVEQPIACPYGKPGDRLWVQEAWRPYSWRPNNLTIQLRADNHIHDVDLPDTNSAEAWLDRICEDSARDCERQAIQEDDGMYVWDGEEANPIRWRPSIFMPRWASRITLEITEVRVQRLQDISIDDAEAEGLAGISKDGSRYKYGIPDRDGCPGEDRWVWAVSFKLLRETAKEEM